MKLNAEKLINYIKIDNKNTRQEFKINPEFNYTLVDVYYPLLSDEYVDYTVIQPNLAISYFIKDRRGKKIISGNIIDKIDVVNFDKLDNGHLKIQKKVLVDQKVSNDYYSIEFVSNYSNEEPFPVHLGIETIEINVPMDNPLATFKEHIDQERNTKLLFSAPFGHGKTTFLNYFFQKYRDEYEAIHIFPVNYSVAANEDIFQYIKAEVLYQLMSKDVKFDKESFARKYTFPEYLKEHFVDFLMPFFRLIPKVGGDINGIVKDIEKVRKDYMTFHDEIQIDDHERVKSYIHKLYEKEGSIIEENFFTQLIRQLNEQLNKGGKKTVLIIDDTDRMDPAHIFRILNVFAAHFDARENTDDGYPNKLGFDKIIIVTDMNNLKYIFQHLYGKNTSFEGYINKFYSKSIYKFDNKNAIKSFIDDEWGTGKNIIENLYFIITDLHYLGILSLRELILIKKTTSSLMPPPPDYISTRYHHFYQELNLLTKVIGFDKLIDKLIECQENISPKESTPNYHHLSKLALVTLKFKTNFDENEHVYKFKDYEVKFKLTENVYRVIEIDQNTFTVNEEKTRFAFSPADFYTLLIDVTKYYKRLIGPSF